MGTLTTRPIRHFYLLNSSTPQIKGNKNNRFSLTLYLDVHILSHIPEHACQRNRHQHHQFPQTQTWIWPCMENFPPFHHYRNTWNKFGYKLITSFRIIIFSFKCYSLLVCISCWQTIHLHINSKSCKWFNSTLLIFRLHSENCLWPGPLSKIIQTQPIQNNVSCQECHFRLLTLSVATRWLTVLDLITTHNPTSTQSSNFWIFSLQPVHFYLLLYKSIHCLYSFELHCQVAALQMSTNNTSFRKISEKKLHKHHWIHKVLCKSFFKSVPLY